MKETISEIRRKIRTRDNGPAVDTMRKLGINYKTIHGLSIAEIKGIAQAYQFNHNLALELWKWDHREFKILATFVEDPKTVSLEQMAEWGQSLNNSELAEQLVINLAFLTGKADIIIPTWFESTNQFTKKAAAVLLAWAAQRATNISDAFYTNQLKKLSTVIDDNLQLSKGISFAYRAIGKRNIFLNTKAIEELKRLKKEGSTNSNYIVEDALWELESDIIKDKLKKQTR